MDDEFKKAFSKYQNPISEEIKKIQEITSPLSDLPNIQPAIPRDFTIPIPIDPNLASEFYKKLTRWISNFDKSLDQEHEVGVRLVNFGQTVTFHLEDMGYWNPSLISFSGYSEDGNPVELIQHVSQISILLVKMKRKDPTQPKSPIGFTTSPEDDDIETDQ